MEGHSVISPDVLARYAADAAAEVPGVHTKQRRGARVTGSEVEVHVVLDNGSIHKAPAIRDWLARRPRYHLHFTPTASSWLNQVERFFALLTARRLKRGVHRSVEELETAVLAYVEHHNAEPKPFRWTRTADQILGSIGRFCERTLAVHAPDLKQTLETHH